MSIPSRQATLYTKDKLEDARKAHRHTKTLTSQPVTMAESSRWAAKATSAFEDQISDAVHMILWTEKERARPSSNLIQNEFWNLWNLYPSFH